MHEPSTPEAMSSADLVKELASNAQILIQRQVKLAKLEAKQELEKGKVMAGLLGSAGFFAHAGVIFLLIAAAMAIGQALAHLYWVGAFIIAGALFLIAGVLGGIGWAKRIKKPLSHSREELQKEIEWARYRTT